MEYLHQKQVSLIVTVDCGITAVEEAKLCRSLGIDLIITDHHECKEILPDACAIVDPHRPDATYPHLDLSGVGIAFIPDKCIQHRQGIRYVPLQNWHQALYMCILYDKWLEPPVWDFVELIVKTLREHNAPHAEL